MILIISDQKDLKTNYKQATHEAAASFNYLDIKTIIIDGSYKQAFEITHNLSKKFLLDKITIAYVNQDVDKIDLSTFRSMGISSFGLSVDSILTFINANNPV